MDNGAIRQTGDMHQPRLFYPKYQLFFFSLPRFNVYLPLKKPPIASTASSATSVPQQPQFLCNLSSSATSIPASNRASIWVTTSQPALENHSSIQMNKGGNDFVGVTTHTLPSLT